MYGIAGRSLLIYQLPSFNGSSSFVFVAVQVVRTPWGVKTNEPKSSRPEMKAFAYTRCIERTWGRGEGSEHHHSVDDERKVAKKDEIILH